MKQLNDNILKGFYSELKKTSGVGNMALSTLGYPLIGAEVVWKGVKMGNPATARKKYEVNKQSLRMEPDTFSSKNGFS